MVAAETGAPCETPLGLGEPHRNWRDPAGREPHELKCASLDHDARDDFDQRPFGGGAADRALVNRAFAGDRRRKLDGLDHFAGAQRVIGGAVRAVAQQLLDAQVLCAGWSWSFAS